MWRSVLMPRSFYKEVFFFFFSNLTRTADCYFKLASALYAAVGDRVAIVDPYTLGYLARVYLGGNNNDRVTYLSDTIPRTGNANFKYSCSIAVRNEGWNTLDHTSM